MKTRNACLRPGLARRPLPATQIGPGVPPRDADEQRIDRAFHVIFCVAAAVMALVYLLMLWPGAGAAAQDNPGEAQYGWQI